MKIIDKTPLQDENGNFSFTARIQGMLKYGFGWFAEMQAQRLLIPQLERVLEKGFVLIRNFTLPGSDIMIPLILVGLGGVYIIYVVSAKGHFEAKGDQWNKIDSGSPQPASVNPLEMATRLAKAFQKYLEIHKIKIPGAVEPVVIAVDPGAHIDSMRPIAKVVKSDAIKAFTAFLLQATPIWRSEQVNSTAERILEPPRPQDEKPVEPVEELPSYMTQGFDDSAPAGDFNSGDLGFSFQEEGAPVETSVAAPQARPQPRPRSAAKAKPQPKKTFGMSQTQLMILGGMVVFWLCLMVVGALFLFS